MSTPVTGPTFLAASRWAPRIPKCSSGLEIGHSWRSILPEFRIRQGADTHDDHVLVVGQDFDRVGLCSTDRRRFYDNINISIDERPEIPADPCP